MTSLPDAPQIKFDIKAWAKMLMLIMGSDKEIGWHGLITRQENLYRVEDIVVYPQTVSGATTSNTVEEYSEWLNALSDEDFYKVRMHCHSHVNMGVTPSGVDEADKSKIIECMKKGDFYIFMIWNKSLDFSVEFYDTDNMIKWTKANVKVEVEGIGDPHEWLKESRKNVKEKIWTYQNPKNFSPQAPYGNGYTYWGADPWGAHSPRTLPDWG